MFRQSIRGIFVTLGLFAMAGALSGCVAAVGAAAVGGATLVAQERSVGMALDDQATRINLATAFSKEPRERFKDVSYTVHEGRVLLAGTVPMREDRIRAAEVAWNTPHVREVVNDITVDNPEIRRHVPSDMWIETRLRSRLMFDGNVRSINYTFESLGGTVYLFGIAQDEAELTRVTEHAREIAGVKQVISHVRLKDDTRRAGTGVPPAGLVRK
jgi:osmotically-inducible protein OsmY